LATLKYLEQTSRLLEETGMHEVGDHLFVLKIILPARSYGLTMIAVEVTDSDPKYTWEIAGIYRAPNEGIRVIEKLAAQNGFFFGK
jgi:hypothetical protein